MRQEGQAHSYVFAEKGISPWETEWLGRWGSSAVRGYVEDARARSKDGADIARKLFTVAPSLSITDTKVPQCSRTAPRFTVHDSSLNEIRAELVKFCGGLAVKKEDVLDACKAQFESVKCDILESLKAFEDKSHEAILVGNLVSGKVQATGSRSLYAAPMA